VLEGIGNIRQTFNNCGPANLTQVLNFYGDDITQEEARLYLKPNYEDRNVSPWQIADYVNEQTSFKAMARSGGNFEQIKRFVAAGYPVVIEKGYELPQSGWWGHYLTVFGYDEDLAEMYSQDSYLGPLDGSGRVDKFEDVAPLWQQFNYTFYVVYQPEQEPEVMSLLDPQLQDDFSMWSHVGDLAQAEVDANPDGAFAWFNLGTSKTRLGALTGEIQYYQDGAAAFDKALEIGLPPRMLWYQHESYLAYLKTDRYQDVITLANVTLDTRGAGTWKRRTGIRDTPCWPWGILAAPGKPISPLCLLMRIFTRRSGRWITLILWVGKSCSVISVQLTCHYRQPLIT
jgi:hypothetical protein